MLAFIAGFCHERSRLTHKGNNASNQHFERKKTQTEEAKFVSFSVLFFVCVCSSQDKLGFTEQKSFFTKDTKDTNKDDKIRDPILCK